MQLVQYGEDSNAETDTATTEVLRDAQDHSECNMNVHIRVVSDLILFSMAFLHIEIYFFHVKIRFSLKPNFHFVSLYLWKNFCENRINQLYHVCVYIYVTYKSVVILLMMKAERFL